MRVAVKDGVDAVTVDRFFEAARTEIREDFRRLPFHGPTNGRVVQQRDALLRSKARQRALEFQRFVDGFLDEGFDRVLTPGPECAASRRPV